MAMKREIIEEACGTIGRKQHFSCLSANQVSNLLDNRSYNQGGKQPHSHTA